VFGNASAGAWAVDVASGAVKEVVAGPVWAPTWSPDAGGSRTSASARSTGAPWSPTKPTKPPAPGVRRNEKATAEQAAARKALREAMRTAHAAGATMQAIADAGITRQRVKQLMDAD
jgi:hypothetical protein